MSDNRTVDQKKIEKNSVKMSIENIITRTLNLRSGRSFYYLPQWVMIASETAFMLFPAIPYFPLSGGILADSLNVVQIWNCNSHFHDPKLFILKSKSTVKLVKPHNNFSSLFSASKTRSRKVGQKYLHFLNEI